MIKKFENYGGEDGKDKEEEWIEPVVEIIACMLPLEDRLVGCLETAIEYQIWNLWAARGHTSYMYTLNDVEIDVLGSGDLTNRPDEVGLKAVIKDINHVRKLGRRLFLRMMLNLKKEYKIGSLTVFNKDRKVSFFGEDVLGVAKITKHIERITPVVENLGYRIGLTFNESGAIYLDFLEAS